MPDPNMIQEHMVSLGFNVDEQSRKQANDAIKSLDQIIGKFAVHASAKLGKVVLGFLGIEKAIEKIKMPKSSSGNHGSSNQSTDADKINKSTQQASVGLQQFAGKAQKYFGEASVAVAAFGAAFAVGTSKLLDGLGNQEIQMEMLSRQMWTTQQQAQEFSYSLKALGANLQDLYLSPTLMKQYEQLHSAAQQMQTPSDYNQAVGLVQGVSLQVKQMKLEAYYALQWIGYYFIKYMQGPISNVKNVLQSVNGVIIKQMPTWTKRIAEVMASFMQAGIYIGDAIGSVYDWLKKIFDYMPGWEKGIVVALAALGIALASNPFFLFMEAILAVILLLDDFETYLHGGKSALAPFWAQLMNGLNSLQANQAMNNFVGLLKSLQTIFLNVGKWFKSMTTTLSKDGTFAALGASVDHLISSLNKLFAIFTNNKNTNAFKSFGDLMTTVIKRVIDLFTVAINEEAGVINMTADVLSGKFKDAAKEAFNLLPGHGWIAGLASNLSGVTSTNSPNVLDSNGNLVVPGAYNVPASSSGAKVNNVTITQNNTIHGANSPQATSNAINSNFNRLHHNLKSVIG